MTFSGSGMRAGASCRRVWRAPRAASLPNGEHAADELLAMLSSPAYSLAQRSCTTCSPGLALERTIMKANKHALAAILASAIGAATVAFAEDKSVPALSQIPIEGEVPSLGGASEWLNSPPLTAAGLRGKVVLVDFWT